MKLSRLTVVAGHYGSGKTNLAVNYAVYLRSRVERVTVCDLDIVNPYFRTKDAEALLHEKDIRLISSAFANTNVELPGIPPEARASFDDTEMYSVVDLGGDDRGAYALGRYAGLIADAEMWMVINMYRPMTASAEQLQGIMEEIEGASSARFTGIVNNSNLGAQTTARDVMASLEYAADASGLTGLPVVMTSAREELCAELSGEIENLFPLRIMVKPGWATD